MTLPAAQAPAPASSVGPAHGPDVVLRLSPRVVVLASSVSAAAADKDGRRGSPSALGERTLELPAGGERSANGIVRLLALETPDPDGEPAQDLGAAGGLGDEDAVRPVLGLLAGLPSGSRAMAMDFLLEAAAGAHPEGWPLAVSRRLFACRELLRERLPRIPWGVEAPRAASVESLLVVDDRTFFITGSARAEEQPLARLTAVSPEGSRVDLHHQLFENARADRETSRFRCFFTSPHPTYLRSGWLLEVENANGDVLECDAPVVDDEQAVRTGLLRALSLERAGRLQRPAEQALSALCLLDRRRRETLEVLSVDQWGEAPRSPAASVVVRLPARLDLIEHQLAQFALDRDFEGVDLIYVLDRGESSGSFRTVAEQVHHLYGVPLRVVTLNQPGGFPTVVNIAASLARGPVLLMLGADVLPDRVGWVALMKDFYDSVPRIGALGPKLLDEEGSLRSGGLRFRRGVRAGRTDGPRSRGLHGPVPGSAAAHPVDAVSTTALMVGLDLYHELGGLRESLGGGEEFAGSDLCLRLLESGRNNWYLPSVELFDLGGHPEPGDEQALQDRHDRWLLAHLWGGRFEPAANGPRTGGRG